MQCRLSKRGRQPNHHRDTMNFKTRKTSREQNTTPINTRSTGLVRESAASPCHHGSGTQEATGFDAHLLALMGESAEGLVTGVGDEISAVILCAPSPQLVEVAAITGRAGERGTRFWTGLPTATPKTDVKRRSAASFARYPKDGTWAPGPRERGG